MNYILDTIKSKKALGLTLIGVLIGANVNGQTVSETGGGELMFYLVIGLVFFVIILVLLTAIYTLQVLKMLVKRETGESTEMESERSLMGQLMHKLTGKVPVQKEQDLLLDHDYDGIKELDNHLPPWWLYLFYFTIAFGIIYMLVYHVFDKLPLQEEEYQTEMAVAAESKAQSVATSEVIDENTITFIEDADMIASGKKVYEMQCVSCHAADGGGIVGPNLTDEYWIHGGGIKDIFKIIKYGVPEKGMISWEQVISPAQMRDVSIYIMKFKGTTPANPKEPQGEIYNESAEHELAEESTILLEETVEEVVSTETDVEEEVVSTEADVVNVDTGDDDELAKGKTIFEVNCVACHLQDGGGIVGPNFTDDYWIHGCSREEIIALIKKGVPAMGMITWEGILSDEEISAVTTYIMAFRGTTPATPKDPQGELCTN